MLGKSALIGCSAISHESEMPSSRSGALVICILEQELRKLLALAGLTEPLAVEPGWERCWAGERQAGGGSCAGGAAAGLPKPDMDFGSGFTETVAGSVALGEASHFGMGGFEVNRTG